jgi:hypothetical protein
VVPKNHFCTLLARKCVPAADEGDAEMNEDDAEEDEDDPPVSEDDAQMIEEDPSN